MKNEFMIIFGVLLSFNSAYAFEATITPASSIKAHPVTSVSKGELTPIEGVVIAKPREAAEYKPEIGGRASSTSGPGKIPIPIPRPLMALACPIVWPD